MGKAYCMVGKACCQPQPLQDPGFTQLEQCDAFTTSCSSNAIQHRPHKYDQPQLQCQSINIRLNAKARQESAQACAPQAAASTPHICTTQWWPPAMHLSFGTKPPVHSGPLQLRFAIATVPQDTHTPFSKKIPQQARKQGLGDLRTGPTLQALLGVLPAYGHISHCHAPQPHFELDSQLRNKGVARPRCCATPEHMSTHDATLLSASPWTNKHTHMHS